MADYDDQKLVVGVGKYISVRVFPAWRITRFDDSNIPICFSRNMYYYQCWKQLCTTFVYSFSGSF